MFQQEKNSKNFRHNLLSDFLLSPALKIQREIKMVHFVIWEMYTQFYVKPKMLMACISSKHGQEDVLVHLNCVMEEFLRKQAYWLLVWMELCMSVPVS